MRMLNIAVIAKNFINLVYPLHCAACKSPLEALDELRVCASCIKKIRPNPLPWCKSCGRALTNASDICAECRKKRFSFERAYSAYTYEDALKELIHQFKYRNRLSLAKILSNLMIDFVMDNTGVVDKIDLVTYVPLPNNRLRKRGFNQSKVLAAKLSERFGIALGDLLEKTRATRPQSELSRDRRLVNVKGAFRAKEPYPVNKRILLVDDVMTTGTTLDECSRVLVDSGAKSVRCLTLARGA